MPTMTINLDERHMQALDALAADTDMSKTGVMRQALRLYQMVHLRARDGQQLAFTKNGKTVPTYIPNMMLSLDAPSPDTASDGGTGGSNA